MLGQVKLGQYSLGKIGLVQDGSANSDPKSEYRLNIDGDGFVKPVLELGQWLTKCKFQQ